MGVEDCLVSMQKMYARPTQNDDTIKENGEITQLKVHT